MRIIHIIPSLMTGGAERLVIDICNELKKRNGIVVKLLVLSERNDFNKNYISFDISKLKSNLKLSISGKNKINIEDYLKIIDDFKPDLIHSHLFQSELLSRWNISENVKYVTHCHDNMSQLSGISIKKSLKKNITDFYERSILFRNYKKQGNHFIAISKNTKNYFLKVLPNQFKDNVFFLPNAIDFKRFHNKNRLAPKNSKLINAVCIGSLVDKKNQKFIIPIVNYLLSKGYDCKFHILGDGPNRNFLEREVKHNKLSLNIFFHGNVQNIEEYMKKADFFIHPATYEPFGLVLLEAMAAGLPVISLDGKGNRDIIKHKKNGFIFKYQDFKLFGNTIIELKENPILYNKFVKEGFKFAKKYDIKTYADKLIDLYEKIIAS